MKFAFDSSLLRAFSAVFCCLIFFKTVEHISASTAVNLCVTYVGGSEVFQVASYMLFIDSRPAKQLETERFALTRG